MGSVVLLQDPVDADFTPLETGRWRSFAVAYINEYGEEKCMVFSGDVHEARRLLRTAMIELEKIRQQ